MFFAVSRSSAMERTVEPVAIALRRLAAIIPIRRMAIITSIREKP
jgi:hypothetical protein